MALGAWAGCAGGTPRPAAAPVDSTGAGDGAPAADGGNPRSAQAIPRRKLGRTGEMVSMIGLGGYHLGKPSEAEATAIMRRAIDEGLTFFDNCWDYHDGESERRMGQVLSGGHREQVFLMTKIDGRTAGPASKQIDDSLRRLRTDYVDLMQIHEVIREEDPAWVFGPDGAIEALIRAREVGKIRFIGFTGHKHPEFHLAMLARAAEEGVRFDAVQMPLNVMDPHYESFEKQVLPRLITEEIGVLGMKPLGAGHILRSGLVSAEECLRYALSLPTSVVITGCERMADLEQALAVARSFQPLSENQSAALLSRTATAGADGRYEKFKTTEQFDGTAHNPQWLTSAQP